ncbi:MAG: biotin/lipoyl-containing protein [Gemmatimonadales bacterium]
MKYVVTIAGRVVTVELTGDRILVDGVEHTGELRSVEGTPIRNLLADGTSWLVPMEPAGRGHWLIQRHGERFEVEVLDERTHHFQSLVGAGKGHQGPAALKAPMPGLVVRILVGPGDAVAAGQGLVVLEAMKMENELKAAGAGVVDQVSAAAGQAVEKGAVLVTFRAPPT